LGSEYAVLQYNGYYGKIVYKSDNHHSKYAIQKVAVKKFLGLTGKNMFNNDQEE
tara:strand:- start:964 stop:1125 length:162 start_codon:yes stop_codon:yes gene_type:complete